MADIAQAVLEIQEGRGMRLRACAFCKSWTERHHQAKRKITLCFQREMVMVSDVTGERLPIRPGERVSAEECAECARARWRMQFGEEA